MAFLRQHALEHVLLTTEGPGHATELAAAAPLGSTVVAVGGDGTVHEVAKGLLGANGQSGERTLAVLPLGSGDDFAFSLGISRHDLPGALERLVKGGCRLVDVGYVNGEPFVNSLGMGFDAQVAFRVRSSPSYLKGLASYLFGVVASLGALKPRPVRVKVGLKEVYVGRSLLVSVQNGPRSGGSFLFAPSASNSDAEFDTLVAGNVGLLDAARIMPRVMKGRHLPDPLVNLFKGSAVRVEWEEPQRAHVDGEPLGPERLYEVSLLPGALKVIC